MREEDYADVPDDVMAEYFACAHQGCCDTYCGGRYWTEETDEIEEEDE